MTFVILLFCWHENCSVEGGYIWQQSFLLVNYHLELVICDIDEVRSFYEIYLIVIFGFCFLAM